MNPSSDPNDPLIGLIRLGRTLSSDRDKREFSKLVLAFFRETIEERTHVGLEQTILTELCHLIRTLPADNRYFLQHYNVVIRELITACRWKQVLYTHSPADIATIASQGVEYQISVKSWLTAIDNGPKNRDQRLLAYLTLTDRDALAYRILRAMLAYLSHRREAVFCLSTEGRIELDKTLGERYLSEQLALYVYLFKNREEALFLVDACTQVKHWIVSELRLLSGNTFPNPEQEAEDAIGQIRLDFLHKYDQYRNPDHPLYVDAGLPTFLTGFINQNHAIGKLLADHINRLSYDDPAVDRDHYDKEQKKEQRGNHTDDQKSWLFSCILQLKPDCQKLLTLVFGDGFTKPLPLDTIADRLGEAIGPFYDRYERCKKNLKKIIDNNRGPGLSPFAR